MGVLRKLFGASGDAELDRLARELIERKQEEAKQTKHLVEARHRIREQFRRTHGRAISRALKDTMQPLVKAGKLKKDTYVFEPSDRYPAWGITDRSPRPDVAPEDRTDFYYSWQGEMNAKISVYIEFPEERGTNGVVLITTMGRPAVPTSQFSEEWLRAHLREWGIGILNRP